MTLEFSELPGRPNRKARGYLDDIARLRQRGYSLEAIRRALANAGITVSKSTVHREAKKALARLATPAQSRDEPIPSVVQPPCRNTLSARPAIRDTEDQQLVQRMLGAHCNGKEFAEAFMRNRISNPLLRRHP
ncbi:hypothetical protein [Aquincola sp. J276]|uniref:hypothetical protein n=1 Tax=Aquincola sp. J276 TaxID=2898432 RepID=UPI002150B3AD|nr:hypothetical protein [Aquincola sp. J276]MCR5868195.1 hypothetical protein [Aquincola sp. J276]